MKETKQLVQLFCTGTHFGKGNNVRLIGFAIMDGKNIGSRAVYYSYAKFHCYVGHVYEVEMSEDYGVMHGKPLYKYCYHDEEVVLKHRLESESNDTIFNATNQSKKDIKAKRDIMNCLEPIRRKWRNTNTLGQVALEARILYYLRTGGEL